MTKVGLELFNYLGGFYSPLSTPRSGIISHEEPTVYYRNNELVIKSEKNVHSVTVYNIIGQKVDACRGSNIRTMQTGHVNPGIYLVHMQDEKTSFCAKVYVSAP